MSGRASAPPPAGELKVGRDGLENARYRVRLDAAGDVASVFDKQLGRELLAAPLRAAAHRRPAAQVAGVGDRVRRPRRRRRARRSTAPPRCGSSRTARRASRSRSCVRRPARRSPSASASAPGAPATGSRSSTTSTGGPRRRCSRRRSRWPRRTRWRPTTSASAWCSGPPTGPTATRCRRRSGPTSPTPPAASAPPSSTTAATAGTSRTGTRSASRSSTRRTSCRTRAGRPSRRPTTSAATACSSPSPGIPADWRVGPRAAIRGPPQPAAARLAGARPRRPARPVALVPAPRGPRRQPSRRSPCARSSSPRRATRWSSGCRSFPAGRSTACACRSPGRWPRCARSTARRSRSPSTAPAAQTAAGAAAPRPRGRRRSSSTSSRSGRALSRSRSLRRRRASTAVRAVALTLPYDLDGISRDDARTDGDFDGQGHTIAGELLPATLTSDDIPFRTGSAGAREGERAGVPRPEAGAARRRLQPRLPARRRGRRRPLRDFTLDGTTTQLLVPDWAEPVGQWNSRIVAGEVVQDPARIAPAYAKSVPVAWVGTHRHDARGANEAYVFTHLFRLRLDVPKGARTLTLPDDEHVRILAITAAHNDNDAVVAAQPFTDPEVGTVVHFEAPEKAFIGRDGGHAHLAEPRRDDPLHARRQRADRDLARLRRAAAHRTHDHRQGARVRARPRRPLRRHRRLHQGDAARGGCRRPGLARSRPVVPDLRGRLAQAARLLRPQADRRAHPRHRLSADGPPHRPLRHGVPGIPRRPGGRPLHLQAALRGRQRPAPRRRRRWSRTRAPISSAGSAGRRSRPASTQSRCVSSTATSSSRASSWRWMPRTDRSNRCAADRLFHRADAAR